MEEFLRVAQIQWKKSRHLSLTFDEEYACYTEVQTCRFNFGLCFRFTCGQNGFVGKPLLAVHSLNACHGQMHSALAVVKKVQSVSIWHKPRSILESNDDQSTNEIFH